MSLLWQKCHGSTGSTTELSRLAYHWLIINAANVMTAAHRGPIKVGIVQDKLEAASSNATMSNANVDTISIAPVKSAAANPGFGD